MKKHRFGFLTLVALSCSDLLFAQAPNLNSQNGFVAGQAYQSSDVDSIDMQSGNVLVNIPLRSFKQQDPVTIEYYLTYSGKNFQNGQFPDSTGVSTVMTIWSDPYVFTDIYGVIRDAYPPAFNGVRLANNQDYRYAYSYAPNSSHPRIEAVTPDGGWHDIILATNPRLSANITSMFDGYAADASGLLMPASDPAQLASQPSTITDRNGVIHTAWFGNEIAGPEGGVSLYQNRGYPAVPIINFDATDHTPVSISDVKGLSLPWHDPNTGHMGLPVSAATCPGALQATTAFAVAFPANDSSTATYIFCYAPITINTHFNTGGPQPLLLSNFTATMVFLQAVVQPNGASWLFEYADRDPGDDPSINYGSLTKITYPTGGTISYTYMQRPWTNQEPDGNPVSRSIASRTVSDGLHSETQSYSFVQGGCTGLDQDGVCSVFSDTVVTATTPTKMESHFYNGDPSTGNVEYLVTTTDLVTNKIRKVFEGFQRVGYGQSDFDEEKGYVYAAGQDTYLPFSTTTILDDGQTSFHLLVHDVSSLSLSPIHSSGNVIEECTYDYGVSQPNTGPGWCPGQTLSHSTTVYASTPAIQEANLLDLPSLVTQYDSGGNPWSQISYTYGTVGNLSDGSYGPINLSQVTEVVDSSGTTRTFHVNSDVNGRTVSVTDPKGHTTSTNFDPSGVYVASQTRPQTGSFTHVSWTGWDTGIDSMKYQTDENGRSANDAVHTSTYSYDVMGRQTGIAGPGGVSNTSTCFTDIGGGACSISGPPFASVTTHLATPDPAVSESQVYDALGRPYIAVRPNASGGSLSRTTVYDGEGNIRAITNPARQSPLSTDPPGGSTAYDYDGFGRMLHQKALDSSGSLLEQNSWTYSGNTVTHTDEAGNDWVQIYDALSRLTEVQEPNPRGGAKLITDYSYDPLGNLVGIYQGGRSHPSITRMFEYDRLSELTYACNPESLSAGMVCDGSTAWSASYSYDSAGNLESKVDARGVMTNYSYDALDRVLQKTYSGTNAAAASIALNTPSVCFAYDATFIGLRSAEWTIYGACTASMPLNGTVSGLNLLYNSLGQRTTARDGSYSYNAAGQISTKAFYVLPAIGLAGSELVNPYANVYLQYSYDADGNVVGISAQTPWSDIRHPTSLFAAPSTSSYGTYGLQQWTLGAGLHLTRTYDSRQRLTGQTASH